MKRLGNVTALVIQRVRQRAAGGQEWARDGRGNAVYVEHQSFVHGCSFQPAGSDEDRGEGQSREQVTSTWTLYAPSGFPGGAIDAVQVHGRRFEIIGTPQRWDHSRLGHVIVTLREVTG